MVHPNESMLRANYASFSAGDPGPLLSSFADDIVWHVSGHSPVAGDYSGRDEILGFFTAMMELYEGTLALEVVDVLANDDHGIVMTREWGERSGSPFEFTAVHAWYFQNGKCVRFYSFNDDAYDELWP